MSQKSYSTGSVKPALEPGVLYLYSMRFCPFAKRTRLVLQHKRIPYKTINIHLQQKPEWFLEDFPGQVPALEWDEKKLNDSTVICDYLDAAYPQTPLHPKDPYLRAKDQILLSAFSKISQCLIGYKLLESTGDEVKAMLQPAIPHFEFFEGELRQRNSKFFGGDQPGMLDFMIWPWFDSIIIIQPVVEQVKLDVLIPSKKCPSLRKWINDMLTIPAVKECQNWANHEQFCKLRKEGIVNYDVGV